MTLPVVFAYLDPGTGSYLWQLTLAGVLAGSYAVRQVWARLRRPFRTGRTRRGTEPPDTDPSAPTAPGRGRRSDDARG